MGERCVFDAIGQSQWTQPQFFTIKSGSPATCPAINKRSSATTSGPANAFANARQLYLIYCILDLSYEAVGECLILRRMACIVIVEHGETLPARC